MHEDIPGDTDGRWLTYRELAAARHIKQTAAVRLVRRHPQWRRQVGNDRVTRVLVPLAWADPDTGNIPEDVTDDIPGDVAPDNSLLLSALEAAVTTLREAKDGQIAALQAAIEAKDGEMRSLRILFDEGQELIEQFRRQLQDAQGAAEALRQADAMRRARGLLPRLRAAWRGE